MQTLFLFPTVLWEDKILLEPKDRQNIIDFYIHLRNVDPGKQYFNNCWQSSDFDFNNQVELNPLLQKLNAKIQLLSKELFSNANFVVNRLWFNGQQEGEFNKTHSHGLGILSGVYYLKCPEGSGRIYFQRDFYEEALIENAWYMCDKSFPPLMTRYEVAPVEGLLLLFPSWLPHGVEKSKSKEPRISIAFNISCQ